MGISVHPVTGGWEKGSSVVDYDGLARLPENESEPLERVNPVSKAESFSTLVRMCVG